MSWVVGGQHQGEPLTVICTDTARGRMGREREGLAMCAEVSLGTRGQRVDRPRMTQE